MSFSQKHNLPKFFSNPNISFRQLKDLEDGTIFRYNRTWAKKDNYSFFSWFYNKKSYCEEIFHHQDKIVAVLIKK
jgi:hypothetical protein